MKNTDLLLDDLLGKAPPKTVNLDIRKLHTFGVTLIKCWTMRIWRHWLRVSAPKAL